MDPIGVNPSPLAQSASPQVPSRRRPPRLPARLHVRRSRIPPAAAARATSVQSSATVLSTAWTPGRTLCPWSRRLGDDEHGHAGDLVQLPKAQEGLPGGCWLLSRCAHQNGRSRPRVRWAPSFPGWSTAWQRRRPGAPRAPSPHRRARAPVATVAPPRAHRDTHFRTAGAPPPGLRHAGFERSWSHARPGGRQTPWPPNAATDFASAARSDVRDWKEALLHFGSRGRDDQRGCEERRFRRHDQGTSRAAHVARS